MSVTAPARGPVTDALHTLLNAAAILTGDGTRPPGGGFPGEDSTLPFVPYAVLHQGVTLDIDGPVADPNADVVDEFQLTSVGVTRASASVIADRARAALLGTALTVPGRHVQLVEWTGGRPADRDDDVTPPLFYVIDLYSVATSPA